MVLVNTIIFGWDMLSRLRALQWSFSEAFCYFQYRRYQTRHFDNFLIFILKMG